MRVRVRFARARAIKERSCALLSSFEALQSEGRPEQGNRPMAASE
nr:MAG TPA: hypothetical protein [Microviridae sp.]